MKTITFASRLKQAREEAGLSVRELSRQCGLSKSALYDMESGKAETIYLCNATLIAKTLKVSACWLCFGEGNKTERVQVD